MVGPDGMIYTGLADGRVLAVSPEDRVAREVGNTGGRRPLGDPIVRGVRARAGDNPLDPDARGTMIGPFATTKTVSP